MTRAFTDKAHPPTDVEFERILGPSAGLWQELRRRLESTHGALTLEWKYYGANSGWTMKVLRGKRNVFFVGPHEGHFVAAFVMGDKAVAAVERSDLPTALVAELVTARRYAEGRGVRIDVTNAADVARIVTLADIKIAQ